MTFNSELIDEVVRNVMQELNFSQASGTAAPVNPVFPAAEPLELTHSVITEEVLASESTSGSTIVIPAGAVITPSGRDYIQCHHISVSNVSRTSADNSATGLVLGVGDIKRLSAPAASAGWSVMPASGNYEAAVLVARECRDRPAICCSTQPSVIACLVNRNTQRRAAVVTSKTCLAELLNDMNPDTVCLSAAGWSFADLLRLLKQLGSRDHAVPTGWKELS